MTAERTLNRRKFLLGAAAVGFSMLNLGGDCDGKTSHQERLDSFKPGEWLSHDRSIIVVTRGVFGNSDDKDIQAVNVRSTWNIHPGSKDFNTNLAGTINVGTRLESVGQIKGLTGGMMTEPVFFVVKRSEIESLRRQGAFNENPKRSFLDGDHSYFYINGHYAAIEPDS